MNLENLMSMPLDEIILLDRMVVSKKVLHLEMGGTSCRESEILRKHVHSKIYSEYIDSSKKEKNSRYSKILYVPISVRELLFVFKADVLNILDRIHTVDNAKFGSFSNVSEINDNELNDSLNQIRGRNNCFIRLLKR